MSATVVFLVAWGLLILAHWANSKPTVNVQQIVEMVVAILLIAFLDSNANTEPIAKGLAWIFLAAVLLSNGSILNSLGKLTTAPLTKAQNKKTIQAVTGTGVTPQPGVSK
jgi:hypothetical protein